MTFAEGEEVTNIEMPDPGWWIGICRGKRGIFPKAYIELNDSAPKEDLGKCGTAIYDYEAGKCNSMTGKLPCNSSFSSVLCEHAIKNKKHFASLIHLPRAQTPNLRYVFNGIGSTRVLIYVKLDPFITSN